MPVQTTNWDQCLQHTAVTDVGMRRSNNQDNFAVVIASSERSWRDRGHVFMVADGMGAHAAGELASKLAADSVPHLYHKLRELSVPEALVRAIRETNAEIHGRGQANADFRNMGTTISMLTLLPQGAVAAHVGDSRIYRLRGHELHQLTFDHSLVWELRAAGKLDEHTEKQGKVPSNVITRSLGPHPKVQVDLEGPFPTQVGDTFLLCSDGLSGEVLDEEIGAMLMSLPPEEAARALVDLANLRGGPDNITVIVAKVTGRELTTKAAGAEPLTVGRGQQQRTVHPAVWIAAGVLFVAGLGLGAGGMTIPAVLSLLGAAAAAGLGALLRFGGGGQGPTTLAGGRRLGRGPHAHIDCTPRQAFVQRLAETVQELRTAVAGVDATIDVARFDRFGQQAVAAAQQGQFSAAVREYSHAISFMMQQLRNRPRGSA